MNLERYVLTIKSKENIWSLLSVILDILLVFINDNFMINGEFKSKISINTKLLLSSFKLIWKIIKAIKEYKTNKELFNMKYSGSVGKYENLNNYLLTSKTNV